ncbi:hypothetical protein A1O7_08239 [Cladophialophora yegresii CBS 114405]|uniref:UBA domain-containing protein n=1 Tax=Cladophialophora yegresii CBS 114405 TaxID=1182544 RepID=W9VI34_9EURO|nr:uncharacterized protein A1O7_08239 [Cladophialophora yegresii CBS 114405]EXJ55312.1 hypothetical protein A1O7_08239 [Cladophialophora yegresii CBS 114405]
MADIMDVMDLTYCEGARLLQHSHADIGSILLQRPNGGLICQHCYLVVADANDVNAITPDQDWALLVSCHVQACGSLHDRRAAYSCYACLETGKASVETTMAELKAHLQVCELIRDIRLSGKYRGQVQGYPTMSSPVSRGSVREPETNPLSTAADMDSAASRHRPDRTKTAQSLISARDAPLDPFAHAQDVPGTSAPQSHVETPQEHNPPLPSRLKSKAPTNAETIYSPPMVRRPEQPVQSHTTRQRAPDMYNIPGGFPGPNAAAVDSRTSSLHDHSSTVPRRKEVRTEVPGPSQASSAETKSFPTAPSRAPPAPPVLSSPAPPPYHQGRDTHGSVQHSVPVGPQSPSSNTNTGPDPVKIQQLVSFGIPRMDAEYLLSRTGGDVNAAAELQLSEMGSLNGHARETAPQTPQGGTFSAPLGSNPVDRRNHWRSK